MFGQNDTFLSPQALIQAMQELPDEHFATRRFSAARDLLDNPRIEQRSVIELMRAMTSNTLPDGRIQLMLTGEKSLPPFPAKSQWKLKDAATMRKRMVEFYESPFGLLAAYETIARGNTNRMTTDDAMAVAPIYTGELHKAWSSPDLMLVVADEPFVDMLEAASLSAPTGPLAREELLSDRGVMFFQKERILPMMDPLRPVRGIMWEIGRGMVNMQVFIDGRHELNTPGPDGIEPPVENYSYLYVLNLLRTQVASPETAGEGATEALGLLRSIAAIARSAQTRSEETVVEHREKRGGRVRSIHKETIRTLSLRNPEYGRYELEGATGKKLRQHWVRGHWRNQWYAGEQINRRIWIDGFVRGSAELGTVTNERVYVARAPKSRSDGKTVAEELTV